MKKSLVSLAVLVAASFAASAQVQLAIDNPMLQADRVIAPSTKQSVFVACTEEVGVGYWAFSLGRQGAAQCIQAQRNLTKRGVEITEANVIAEMTAMTKPQTSNFSADCLANAMYDKNGKFTGGTAAQRKACKV
jgi:hypothetical protein